MENIKNFIKKYGILVCLNTIFLLIIVVSLTQIAQSEARSKAPHLPPSARQEDCVMIHQSGSAFHAAKTFCVPIGGKPIIEDQQKYIMYIAHVYPSKDVMGSNSGHDGIFLSYRAYRDRGHHIEVFVDFSDKSLKFRHHVEINGIRAELPVKSQVLFRQTVRINDRQPISIDIPALHHDSAVIKIFPHR
jgi:hypothetical protein